MMGKMGVAQCDNDNDCLPRGKCCNIQASNCGRRECVFDWLERVVRPGSCPPITKGHFAPICMSKDKKQRCGEDAHCPENQKCCTDACGSTKCLPVAGRRQY